MQRPGKGVVGLREYLLTDPARHLALLAYLDLGDVALLQGYAFVARGAPSHAYPRDVNEALQAVQPVVKAALDGQESALQVCDLAEHRGDCSVVSTILAYVLHRPPGRPARGPVPGGARGAPRGAPSGGEQREPVYEAAGRHVRFVRRRLDPGSE